ncbi:hypothetical protein LLH23_00130 [bacterium]|nr:hypothetical protein [bacterium]
MQAFLSVLLGGVVLSGCLLACSSPTRAATYYVSDRGSDDADGLAPERAWQSLAHVSKAPLQPGDTVLFRRGGLWRGSLRPRSGAEGAPVTYGAYGQGPKPLFLGSVSRNDPADWRQEAGGCWSTGGAMPEPQEALPPVDAVERAMKWGLHTEGGAQATRVAVEGAESPAACRIECAASGKSGNQIQLITTGLRIEEGRTYRLRMSGRCTQPVVLRLPSLMSTEAPWTGFSTGPALRVRRMGPETTTCTQYYTAAKTTDRARLTLYLGGALPAGATLEIDRVSFAECPAGEVPNDGVLPVDVGNIIFGNEQSCGVKVWTREDLKTQGQYWYDREFRKLYLVSATNPALFYKQIECALTGHIVNQGGTSWVIYENLALKYGAAHGFGGGGTHHLIIRDCDIAWIGGADQYGDGTRTVRFGNGIEFWGSAHDNLVERCRLWEIYDAALTNQNGGAVVQEYNLTYRNNIIWNSEYSFEYWNRPEASETYNIRFVNNTCLNAGHGWGHAQRPNPSGRHLCFYTSPAQAHDILIANNIFDEATKNAFYAPTWSAEAVAALQMDHNLWRQRDGVMISICGRSYTQADFGKYQAELSKEPHSLTGDPRLVAPEQGDYRLAPGSPCLNAGMDVGLTGDFAGTAVPQGAAPDLGAYEAR